MSRTGKKIINYHAPTKVKMEGETFHCQGIKGELQLTIPDTLQVEIQDQHILVSCKEISTDMAKSLLRFRTVSQRALWGTTRQNIANSVIGVSTGFSETLILEGVGFRASVSGHKLTLSIGFSHPVEYTLPATVSATVEGNTKIVLSSCNNRLLGQVAAEIRMFRPPEPYKGKGIRYEKEVVRRKAGKTGKK